MESFIGSTGTTKQLADYIENMEKRKSRFYASLNFKRTTMSLMAKFLKNASFSLKKCFF